MATYKSVHFFVSLGVTVASQESLTCRVAKNTRSRVKIRAIVHEEGTLEWAHLEQVFRYTKSQRLLENKIRTQHWDALVPCGGGALPLRCTRGDGGSFNQRKSKRPVRTKGTLISPDATT